MPEPRPLHHASTTGTGPGYSLLDGGELARPPVHSLTAALRRAAERGDTTAIRHIDEDGRQLSRSYQELLDEAARTLTGIRRAGVRPGELILLQVADPARFLVAFWACVLGGFVPVPVPTDAPAGGANGDDPTERIWRALGGPWVLSDSDPDGTWSGLPPRADGGHRARWLGPPEQLRVNPVDPHWHVAGWDDLALLTLTAGSSGTPKIVRLSHGNILSRCAGTAEANDLSAATVTVNWMPLAHVSGLVMFHLRDVFLGCTQIHASRRWVLDDPLRWLDVIHTNRADTTWAPNSAYDLVSDRIEEAGARGWELSCLRYIMNGGQPVRARTVRRFLTLLEPCGLPTSAMRPGWGMSETSAGVVDHRIDLADVPESDIILPVGRPQPGVRVRVVDGDDRVVPEGVTGQLQVTGAPVSCGYQPPDGAGRRDFTGDGWFRTGDLAVVRAGALSITGSIGALIRHRGRSYLAAEIEAAVERLPMVMESYTVACAVGPGEAELAIFCVLRTPGEPGKAIELIRQQVQDRCGTTPEHVIPLAKEQIPKTPTGKPKRAELRELFHRRSRSAAGGDPRRH